MNFISFKHTSPIEKKLKLSVSDFSEIRSSVTASVEEVGAEIDRAQVVLRCNAALSIRARARRSVKALASMKVGEACEEARNSSRVTVYYPEASDTLFGVAKKFRTTVRDIAVNNSLTESVVSRHSEANGLAGVKKLIIR